MKVYLENFKTLMNMCIKEEITMEFEKYLVFGNKNTTYQNLKEATKLACRSKSRTLNV